MDIIKRLDELKLEDKPTGLNKQTIQKRYNLGGDYYLYEWDNGNIQLSKKIDDESYYYISTRNIKDKELVGELKVIWYIMNI